MRITGFDLISIILYSMLIGYIVGVLIISSHTFEILEVLRNNLINK